MVYRKSFKAFLDEHLEKALELVDDVFVLRQSEGYICQISEENWCVVNTNIFMLAHDISDDNGDDLGCEENRSKLRHRAGRFGISCCLFNRLRDKRREVTQHIHRPIPRQHLQQPTKEPRPLRRPLARLERQHLHQKLPHGPGLNMPDHFLNPIALKQELHHLITLFSK